MLLGWGEMVRGPGIENGVCSFVCLREHFENSCSWFEMVDRYYPGGWVDLVFGSL